MAIGIPPKHTDYFPIPTGIPDSRAAVLQTLRTLNWKVKEQTDQSIKAAVPLSFFSYGARVRITLETDRTITICSQNLFPLQLIDWGKNKANVERFLAEIRRQTTTNAQH